MVYHISIVLFKGLCVKVLYLKIFHKVYDMQRSLEGSGRLCFTFQNSRDEDLLWKAEFTYKHKNQSSNE